MRDSIRVSDDFVDVACFLVVEVEGTGALAHDFNIFHFCFNIVGGDRLTDEPVDIEYLLLALKRAMLQELKVRKVLDEQVHQTSAELDAQ